MKNKNYQEISITLLQDFCHQEKMMHHLCSEFKGTFQQK